MRGRHIALPTWGHRRICFQIHAKTENNLNQQKFSLSEFEQGHPLR
jgi:hypothetical protein